MIIIDDCDNAIFIATSIRNLDHLYQDIQVVIWELRVVLQGTTRYYEILPSITSGTARHYELPRGTTCGTASHHKVQQDTARGFARY